MGSVLNLKWLKVFFWIKKKQHSKDPQPGPAPYFGDATTSCGAFVIASHRFIPFIFIFYITSTSSGAEMSKL